MGKIRLDLEQLEVESFATTQGEGTKRGTVRGRESHSFNETINCSGADCGTMGGTNQIDTSISGDMQCICLLAYSLPAPCSRVEC